MAFNPATVGISKTVFFGGGGVSPGTPIGTTSNLEIYNVRIPPNNVPNDGTPASALINAIIAGIGGANATIYFPPGNYGLDANVTFPANIRVMMEKGAMFRAIAAGVTVAFNGNIAFPAAQIFDSSLFTLNVTFGGPSGQLSAQWWGATGGGIANDSAGLAAVAAVAAVSGATVYLPKGTYRFTAAMVWPPGVNYQGEGIDTTILKADGAINGIDGVSGGYLQSGSMRDLTLLGVNGALIGVNVVFRSMPRLERVKIQGFTRQGVYFNSTIMPKLDHCLLSANGDATRAQVEVESSTTFLWDHSYISGGNAGTIAGLAIDKTTGYTVLGGAIESTGIPIRLCGKADAAIGTNAGLILGTDLENPSGGADTYIELGAGWTGAANQGVTRLTVGGVNESPSGTVSAKYGIKAQNSDTVHLLPCKWGTPAVGAGGVSNIELVGLTNIRWSMTIQSSVLGAGLSHVRENGVARTDALPYAPWIQQGQGSIVLSPTTAFALNSATPDTAGTSYVATNSTVATTILNLTSGGIAPQPRQLLFIYAGDVNTTLKHANAGVGKFSLKAGVDKLLAVGSVTMFVYDPNLTAWREVG